MRITIEGAPGEGKTTIAVLIARSLRAVGIDAVVKDRGEKYPMQRTLASLSFQLDRLRALRDRGTSVEIVTVQSRPNRTSRPAVDYEPCGECGYDHAYEPQEAREAHLAMQEGEP